MSIGPFMTYAPPGVYTITKTDANVSSLVAGLRIPVYIGVGQEELEQLDLEMIRGSSSTLDQQINNEDVSASFVVDETNPNNPVLGVTDGSFTKVRVRNFPIVDGQGFGRVTNDVKSVSATVNGEPVALGSVQGQGGYVTFQVPPSVGDDVRVTYYFHRGDTRFTDDVSSQVESARATLTSPGFAPFTVTSGFSDTFVVTVNGTQYSIMFAPGTYTASALKSQIDSALITTLSTSVFTDGQGLDHIQFTSDVSILIGAGTANGPLGFSSGTTTDRNRDFVVYNRPIVDGSGGGITTTDPSKVVVKVNNVQKIPSAVDGRNGIVTLAEAPAPGSTVTVQYWANTWQDTFDYLPNTLVTGVIRSGISPGRSDYIQGTDFVVSNPSPDTSIVHWGTSYAVSSGTHTAGAELFDTTQIIPSLVDEKLFLAPCTRVIDTTTVPAKDSPNMFTLPAVPTLGNGRDTPLGSALFSDVANSRNGVVSNRPDLITVRVGRNLGDALNRAAATVVEVDSTTRRITLKDPVPPDYNAYATFWYSRVTDDTFTLTCKVAGPIGAGQYEVFSNTYNMNLMQVRFGTKSPGLTDIVQWPRGAERVPDAFHSGGTPVPETVTVTFGDVAASNAVYTNKGAQPYSLYTSSVNWRTIVNSTTVDTVLSTATSAWLVGTHVTPSAGLITIPASPDNVLEITIDGTDISAPITAGTRTPAQIVTDMNSAIDTALGGVNNLAGYKQIGTSTGDVIFYIKSLAVPAALPTGFDSAAYVQIRPGTIETTLGLATFQRADGTTGAINKPATMVGTKAGDFTITTGLNDILRFRMNGVQYEVTLPGGSPVTPTAVRNAINAVPGLTGVASIGTGANLNHIRLMSNTNADNSSFVMLDGTANDVLGFTVNDFTGQTKVTAMEIANRLNGTPTFVTGLATTGAIAYSDTIDGQTYLTIESMTTGVTTSSIAFGSTANSAFNRTTGLNITPGVDSDIGEDAYNKFTLTSDNGLGSTGVGIPGQTYTDARTGLRFTVLPSADGSYPAGEWFKLVVSPTFVVDPSVPTYAMPGLETIVTNTVSIGVNDTGVVQTFNPSGVEPAVGDFYYISYKYMKQDFSTRVFTNFKQITANFGPVSAENRVTLAAYLGIINGAVLVGIKQVTKVVNTNQASDAAFVAAIQELATPMPGNIKPDILVPLATSPAVYAYLTQHCEIMSDIHNQSERMGFIGFASGTSPTTAQTITKSLVSSRIVAFYPDSAVITLQDELGQSYETLVDGSFLAAAVAGAVVSPAVDVATPYTRRRIQGITRLRRIMDPVEANQTAVSGITILEDIDPIIRVRHGLTTDMASPLTRLPTVTQIKDYVQQQSRLVLDSFVGTKFLPQRTNEVEVSMTGLFKHLVSAEIVGAFSGISASVDPDDPTTLNFEAFYQPIFPLLYLVLTFNLRTKI